MKARRIRLWQASGLCVLASIPAAAAAQSTVTLYGALDAYVARFTASGASALNAVNSGFNPNNLGFAMREDLGGGLVAGGVLEMQPTLDTGTLGQGGKAFGRQSYVYLGSTSGTLSLGRIHTPGRAFGIKQAATGWLSSDPGGNLMMAMGTSLAPAMNVDTTGSRLNNAVQYVSPSLGGVKLTVMHALGEGQPLSSGAGKVTTAGLAYAGGPLSVDFVYSKVYDIKSLQIGQTDFALGAAYDFRVAKVFASVYVRDGSAVATPGSTAAIAGSKATDRMVHLGVAVPVGNSDSLGFSAAWLRVDDTHRGRFAANMGAPFASVVDDTAAWSVAYTMYLSKRTQLFAAYGSLSNESLGTASFNPGFRPTAGGRSTILATGLRHNF